MREAVPSVFSGYTEEVVVESPRTVAVETRRSDREGRGATEGRRREVNPRRRILRGPARRTKWTSIYRILALSINLLPLTIILLGSFYLNDCPADPKIPIWLISAGLLSLLPAVVDLAVCFKKYDYGRSLPIRLLDHLLVSAMLVWLVIGSVWIYSRPLHLYCHPTVYWFSHLLVSFIYIFVLLVTLFLIIIGGMVAMFG